MTPLVVKLAPIKLFSDTNTGMAEATKWNGGCHCISFPAGQKCMDTLKFLMQHYYGEDARRSSLLSLTFQRSSLPMRQSSWPKVRKMTLKAWKDNDSHHFMSWLPPCQSWWLEVSADLRPSLDLSAMTSQVWKKNFFGKKQKNQHIPLETGPKYTWIFIFWKKNLGPGGAYNKFTPVHLWPTDLDPRQCWRIQKILLRGRFPACFLLSHPFRSLLAPNNFNFIQYPRLTSLASDKP